MKILSTIAMLIYFSMCMPAHSAGINCLKAVSSFEKRICNNGDLLDSDTRMAVEYAAAFKRLSKQGRKLLYKSQVNWLKYVELSCQDENKVSNDTDYNRCLQDQINFRGSELHRSGRKNGPYVFNTLQTFNVSKTVAANGVVRFKVTRISYPVIDNIRNNNAEEFNKWVVNRASSQITTNCVSPQNNLLALKVNLAADNLILISEHVLGFGECNKYDHTNKLALDFTDGVRVLNSTDVFGNAEEWQGKFSSLFVLNLERRTAEIEQANPEIKYQRPLEIEKSENLKELLIQSHNLSNWDVYSAYLIFNTKSVKNCYSCSWFTPQFSWSEIRKILPINSPFRRFRGP
jgi:uncharacterized protein YecT (DUF1311 family)